MSSSATASYRLLPHIQILSPIAPEHAAKFQACFPPGVVDLEHDESTGKNTKVVIKNPRLDTVSREVLRYPEFRDKVKLGRVRDHFICRSSFMLLLLLRAPEVDTAFLRSDRLD